MVDSATLTNQKTGERIGIVKKSPLRSSSLLLHGPISSVVVEGHRLLLCKAGVRIRLLLVLLRNIRLVLKGILQLSADLRYLVQLLDRRLVTLQCGLNHLRGFLFSVGQFFKPLCILLLLLKQVLVILASLLSLLNELLSNLLALMKRLLSWVICELHVFPPNE